MLSVALPAMWMFSVVLPRDMWGIAVSGGVFSEEGREDEGVGGGGIETEGKGVRQGRKGRQGRRGKPP
jgi:hypothetical protein